jgi:hypothetical protein
MDLEFRNIAELRSCGLKLRMPTFGYIWLGGVNDNNTSDLVMFTTPLSFDFAE